MLIKATELTLVYQNRVVGVKDLDFKIEAGEVVLVLGSSGAGKSSLIKLLLGAELPTKGKLEVFGHSITPGSKIEPKKLRQMISPVFQDFKLLLEKSALENVAMGLRILGYRGPKMYTRGKSALDQVGLSHKGSTPVKLLSYGERQRVAVARAIARKSQLIIADEPTGNLDEENSINIMKLLIGLRSPKRIVIIATHENRLLESFVESYRSLKLMGGHLVFDGSNQAREKTIQERVEKNEGTDI